MSGKPTKTSKTETAAGKKISVPVQLTDLSIYDGTFESMKERFAAEMKRIDEEMQQFSKNLLRFNGETTTLHTGATSANQESAATSWETITMSPLIEQEGELKVLKLQFDLSEYDSNEISVRILDNLLIITAAHQESTEADTAYKEFNREFLLPAGTDPETVQSSLSKDGVLTVRAPLHIGPIDHVDKSNENSHNENNED